MRTTRYLFLASISALLLASGAEAQNFEGRIHVTTYTLSTEALMGLTSGNPAAVMDLSTEEIAAAMGVETESYTTLVRGTVVHTVVGEGEMTMDYGSNTFSMYDPQTDTHATWTGDELKEFVRSMMGGAGGDMESAMEQMRAAMGVEEGEAEGPYRADGPAGCGEWWGGHMGDVGVDSNPMASGWMIRACVTQEYPEALASMRAMATAAEQFDMMDLNDAEDDMEVAMAEHGLPVVFKRLKKGGPMNPALTFSLTINEIEPGAVDAADVTPRGREVTLQEFMMSMMSRQQ